METGTDAEARTLIVILGGGFGGIYAALRLEKALAGGASLDVTLVNRENFFLFTPMLHEVAASDLEMTHIVNPIRKLLRRVQFVEGQVEAIDLHARRVVVSHGGEHHHHDLEYDHLVLALGSITNFYSLPGVQDRALTMKTLGDAIHLRNRLIQLLEEANFECACDVRAPLLSIVVAGGGFAGVETIAAEKELAERKVEIRLKTRISAMSEDGVTLSDGTMVPTKTLVWTAGTSPNPLLATLPCMTERGRLVVNKYMEVPEWPGVWALGDCAVIPDPRTGKRYPPTAQHALRQGKILAGNILAAIRGGEKKPFVFATIGLLASIGRRTGVARILVVNFSGFIAWWLWRTIYLSKLPRFEKKCRVALDWLLDLIFSKDIVQFQTLRAQTVSHTEDRTQAT